jgi:hypothetical protein
MFAYVDAWGLAFSKCGMASSSRSSAKISKKNCFRSPVVSVEQRTIS